jgi:hypothetical protein
LTGAAAFKLVARKVFNRVTHALRIDLGRVSLLGKQDACSQHNTGKQKDGSTHAWTPLKKLKPTLATLARARRTQYYRREATFESLIRMFFHFGKSSVRIPNANRFMCNTHSKFYV